MTSSPQKKHYSCLYVFFWLLHFFRCIKFYRRFSEPPKTPIYLKCSFFMKDGRTSWRRHGSWGNHGNQGNQVQFAPNSPQAPNQAAFFEKFSRRKKIVCHSKKYDFQRKFPTVAMPWDSMPTEFDYLILPHNIMAVLTISPVILSCFWYKEVLCTRLCIHVYFMCLYMCV